MTTFVSDMAITAIGVLLLVLVKFAVLRVSLDYFPAESHFWDWSVTTPANLFYPVTAIFQEFLSRGVLQECLGQVITGEHASIWVIVVSPLIFGVLHIPFGLPFMAGETVLSLGLGTLYSIQGNIWGLSTIHWC